MRSDIMDTTQLKKLVRPQILRASYEYPRNMGSVLLDFNESPYATSGRLNRYPDTDYKELRAALAKYCGTKPESILAGNGSDEIIDIAVRTFAGVGDSILCVEPGYSMYGICALANGAQVKKVSLAGGFGNFSLDANAVLNASDARTKMIFIVSPNSPLGSEMDLGGIEKIAKNANAIVFVDEAYIEFGGKSAAPLIEKYPNLLVCRTLSKAWGLAGVRIGYAIANPALLSFMLRVRLPYNISSPNTQIALAALKKQPTMQKNVQKTAKERAWLAKGLASLGFSICPSIANFLLVRPPAGTGASVLQKSLEEKCKILVRDRSSVKGIPNTLRISIGTRKENCLLLAALCKLIPSPCKFDSILFDVDGVLLDVSRSYISSIEKTANGYFEKTGADVRICMQDVLTIKGICGFNNEWDATYRIVSLAGKNLQSSKPLTQEEKQTPLYAQLRSSFNANYLSLRSLETPLIKESTFQELQNRGFALGIVTSRPREELQYALDTNKWGAYFLEECIVCQEDCAQEKPSPAPILLAKKRLAALGYSRPLYIGDSISDERACIGAGIPIAMVSNPTVKGDFKLQKTDEILEVLA